MRGGRSGFWRPDKACETGKRGSWVWEGAFSWVWELGGFRDGGSENTMALDEDFMAVWQDR